MTRSYRNSEARPPIMQGAPVPPEWRVPAHDWDAPPWNRWSFQHMRELVPTVPVAAGGVPWAMPGAPAHAPAEWDRIAFQTARGQTTSWARMLDDTYTDATLIWQDGRILVETYCNGMTPESDHIVFSVSKSVIGTLAGILIAEGRMDPAAPVTDYLPELAATAWAGARLGHVLDMTSGVRFDETYGNRDAQIFLLDVAANLKPPYPWMQPETLPGSIWDLILRLTEREAPHGARFDYRSIETDVLGQVIERVTGQRLAELVSDRLWRPMGAERDGYFTVDRAGFAMADGGFNAGLRDLARFGRLLLEDGRRDGRAIVPAEWIADIRRGDHGLFNDYGRAFLPDGRYRNQFWIMDAARPAHLSLGIFGQHILVDPDSGTVAVKLSSWPDFLSPEGWLLDWINGVRAVVAAHRG